MKTFLDCIPCFFRQALDAARLVTKDESIHEQILRDVLDLTRTMDLSQNPPAVGQKIHRCIRQWTKNPDPYREMKQKHNEFALQLYQQLKPVVDNADDPLETAARLAIAGNIIDLGVKTSIADEDIHKTIQQSITAPFSRAMVEQLRRDVTSASSILYLTDNAGEIVFDRLLIEQLPIDNVIVAVKGFPVINDATMDDAAAAGLTGIVTVIDNGSDAPGTILKTCSDAFLSCFEHADLVIAKGQGNYETLSDIDKNIYFLLKVKCPVIAGHLNHPVGTMVLEQKR